METHQIMDLKYRVMGEFGEEVLRGRTDWNWHLYYSKDSEYESIDALPKEYLSKCKQATGGHLERDNLFEVWKFKQDYNRAMDETAKHIAESIKYTQQLEERYKAGDTDVLLINNRLYEANLNELDLYRSELYDEDMASLLKMTNLKKLNIRSSFINDLSVLTSFTELTVLSLYNNSLGDNDITTLNRLTNLTELNISIATQLEKND
jgi:hypothetical protein